EGSKVHLGSSVKVDMEGQVLHFRIVESIEANPLEKKISHQSPVGKALLGATVGQLVEVLLPQGRLAYRVLEVF
ncbi:MAG: GreA/GreB family elongation factor, partial [bacterium]|nr:GreA/GreB family elongation factor [bacterium]